MKRLYFPANNITAQEIREIAERCGWFPALPDPRLVSSPELWLRNGLYFWLCWEQTGESVSDDLRPEVCDVSRMDYAVLLWNGKAFSTAVIVPVSMEVSDANDRV